MTKEFQQVDCLVKVGLRYTDVKNFDLVFSTRAFRKGSLPLASFSKVKIKQELKNSVRKKSITVGFLNDNGKDVSNAAKIEDDFVVVLKHFLLVLFNECDSNC